MIRLVHVPTAVDDATLAAYLADLPPGEQRTQHPGQRRRVVAHAVLRRLLGERLGLAPQQVRLQRQRWGKPVLARTLTLRPGGAAETGVAPHPVHFSLSYTGDTALLALASTPVGVDIEQVVPHDVAQVARHVYAPEEQARLRACAQPALTFLDIWAAKEAVLKFLGVGFRVEPRKLCVPPAAQDFQPVCVTSVLPRASACVVANWRLAQGYAVALSTVSAPSTISWEHYAHARHP